MNQIVLLGGNVEAAPIAQRALELGFYPIVVDIDARCAARDVPGVRFVQASCYHGEQVIAALKAAQVKPDGVMCAATDAPIACAEVAAAFGLPGLSVEAAKFGQDKFMQKAKLHEADIRVPDYHLTRSVNEISYAGAGGVIKPLDSRGGRGVVRLLPGVDPVFAYEIAKANSPTGRVMVEEWLDGPQLSTESITQNGKVLFTAIGLRNYDRLDEFAPNVIENGAAMPYGDDALKAEIDTVIEAACRALGWNNMTCKGDLVVHNGKVYVIELACRLSGGFFSSHYIPLSSGVDFIGLAIKMALGYTVEKPIAYPRQNVCQLYAFPSKMDIGKVIRSIPNDKPDSAVFHSWNVHAGQVIEPVTSHPQRLGQAIAVGESALIAEKKAATAIADMMAGLLIE